MEANPRALSRSAFISPAARAGFIYASVCTFLVFLGNSATFLLAPIFRLNGLSDTAGGLILGSYGVSAVIGILVSGPLARRIGTVRTLQFAALGLTAGHLIFHLTNGDAQFAFLTRVGQGLAYGLLLPALMIYGKNQLSKHRLVFFFGMFASMVPLPNVVGPALAEWILNHYGVDRYFLITGIPMLAGAVGFLVIPRQPPHAVLRSGSTYSALICRAALRFPYMSIAIGGLMFGLLPSYMAELMLGRGIPTGAFFTPFTLAFLVMRFGGLAALGRLSQRTAVSSGLLLMGAMLLVIGADLPGLPGVIGAASLFGVGYAIVYPTTSVMVSSEFSESERDKPIALFNVFFVAATYLTPLMVGATSTAYELSAQVLALGITGVLAGGLGFIGPRLFRTARAKPEGG